MIYTWEYFLDRSVTTEDGCMEWTKGRSSLGYGRVTVHFVEKARRPDVGG